MQRQGRTSGAAGSHFTPARHGWKPYSHKPKSVGEFLPLLMRPAFEKFGFSASAILTEWGAIAGPELAAFTAPERLKWPGKTGAEETSGRKSGATLILRVAGARALEVEYMRSRLIERINAAFGYRAVSDIRVLQAPVGRRQEAPKRLRAETSGQPCEPALDGLPEGALKNAFARMASGLKARRAGAETAGA